MMHTRARMPWPHGSIDRAQRNRTHQQTIGDAGIHLIIAQPPRDATDAE
jgi:hypothetical protein